MTSPSRESERDALDLFERALELPSQRRAQWINEQMGEPQSVRDRALSLLRAGHASHVELETGGAASLLGDDDPPERVGPYKIVERLGRGGMGAVYLAERDSGDFTHQTAIKFIRPGVFSETLIERFGRERQTLAQLKHPHIAQLYDGGETPDGTPYFIMEYIDGVPIPRWLAAMSPSLSQRLALFTQVCDAVEFAHQNLIVHRDLTPSNVLVTRAGLAKLIDFGIAKPPSDEAEHSPPPSLASLSVTPGFAAPERSQSGAANTLGDIYSLGKILQTLVADAGDPELAAIAAKATDGDPHARYATARALSQDVERYQVGFAISAYSSRPAYRLGKFVRRQRLAVAAASFAAVCVVAGLIATALAYQRAEVAREKAMVRFEDVRSLAKFQLFDLYDSLSRVAGNTQARGDLAKEAQGYLSTLANDPDAPPDVQLDTAAGYVRLARIMGVPSRPSLGQPVVATQHLAKAEQLLAAYEAAGFALEEAFYATKAEMHAARALIRIHEDMTMEKAQQDIAAANNALSNVPAKTRGRPWHMAKRATLYSEADHADMSSDAARIRAIARTLRANARRWPPSILSRMDADLDLAMASYLDGLAHYVTGAHVEAVTDFAAANAVFTALDQKRFNDPVVLYLQAWTNYLAYGSAAQVPGYVEQEGTFIDRSQSLTDRLKALEERDAMVKGLNNRLKEARAQYLAKTGDYGAALSVQNDVLGHYRAQMDASSERRYVFDVAYTLITMAFLQRDIGETGKACDALVEADALLAPIHARQSLPSFMARAGDELPKRIALCQAGKDIGRQETVFEVEGWSDPE